MAKRIQDFRNFNSSNGVATSEKRDTEVVAKPKKAKKYKEANLCDKKQKNDELENKKNNKFIVLFFVFLIITGVAVGCLFSPTFNFVGVIVSDGVNVSSVEIRNSFEVANGTNIFKIDYDKVEESIEKLPYIKNAEAKIELPNEIKIEFIERKPFALVKYLESYMVLDKYGYILEITREKKYEELPVIYNIEFDSYEIGKQFSDTAKTKYDNVVYLLENATQNNFKYEIAEINYESIGNVKIWIKEADIEIIYGEIDRDFIMEKLNCIEEIFKRIEGKKGKLDISSSDYLDGKIVFTERI